MLWIVLTELYRIFFFFTPFLTTVSKIAMIKCRILMNQSPETL